MSVNMELIAQVERLAKSSHVIAIAREYDDILGDIGNVEDTAEMVAMFLIAKERAESFGK